MPIIKSIKFCKGYMTEPETEDTMANEIQPNTAVTLQNRDQRLGPWTFQEINGWEMRVCEDFAPFARIAQVYGDQAVSNARLIAAAPELLTALTGLIVASERIQNGGRMVSRSSADLLLVELQAARTAIAKARHHVHDGGEACLSEMDAGR